MTQFSFRHWREGVPPGAFQACLGMKEPFDGELFWPFKENFTVIYLKLGASNSSPTAFKGPFVCPTAYSKHDHQIVEIFCTEKVKTAFAGLCFCQAYFFTLLCTAFECGREYKRVTVRSLAELASSMQFHD